MTLLLLRTIWASTKTTITLSSSLHRFDMHSLLSFPSNCKHWTFLSELPYPNLETLSAPAAHSLRTRPLFSPMRRHTAHSTAASHYVLRHPFGRNTHHAFCKCRIWYSEFLCSFTLHDNHPSKSNFQEDCHAFFYFPITEEAVNLASCSHQYILDVFNIHNHNSIWC